MKPAISCFCWWPLIAGGLAAFLATRTRSDAAGARSDQRVQESQGAGAGRQDPIGVGERLSTENVQWQDWPEGAVRKRIHHQSATPEGARPDERRGRPLRILHRRADPEAKLVHADQGYLSAVLDKGKRGVSIQSRPHPPRAASSFPTTTSMSSSRASGPRPISETIAPQRQGARHQHSPGRNRQATRAEAQTRTHPNAGFRGRPIATLELDPPQARDGHQCLQLGRSRWPCVRSPISRPDPKMPIRKPTSRSG